MEFKKFKSYGRAYGKNFSCYKVNQRLKAILAQNEKILNKLKEIEEFLCRKFANENKADS